MTDKQDRAAKHNALSGDVAMALACMRRVAIAKSCTRISRIKAERIIEELIRLQPLLKTRID